MACTFILHGYVTLSLTSDLGIIHCSLINNIQRRDHTEFQNNGFVNNALEADIELGEDIDPGMYAETI